MKKAFAGVISAILLFLFACNPNSSNAPTKPASDSASATTNNNATAKSDQAERNMKAVYKGIETGDLSAMDTIADKNIVDHDTPKGEMKGLDSIKNMLADIHNHFTDLKIDLIACGTDGDYVLTLSRMTGKTKDASMGVPANTSVDNTSVDVVKVVNGKATDHWGYERPHPMPPMHNKEHKGKM